MIRIIFKYLLIISLISLSSLSATNLSSKEECDQNNNPNECHQVGFDYIKINNYLSAYKYFLKGAYLGQHNSMYSLGIMNLEGEGRKINLPKTFAWFKLAGNYIPTNTGEWHIPRSKIRKYKNASSELKLKMTKEEITQGEQLLSKYNNKIIINKKRDKSPHFSLKNSVKGCNNGYINECHSAGMSYFNLKDYGNSYKYLQISSLKGYHHSTYMLGYFYEHAIGRDANLIKAYAYYKLAYKKITGFNAILLKTDRFKGFGATQNNYYKEMHLDDEIPLYIARWNTPAEKINIFKQSYVLIKDKMSEKMILDAEKLILKLQIIK